MAALVTFHHLCPADGPASLLRWTLRVWQCQDKPWRGSWRMPWLTPLLLQKTEEARAWEIDYFIEILRISGSGPTAMLTLVLASSSLSQLLFLECSVQCHPPTTWVIHECFLMYLRDQENHHHFSLQILFLLYLSSSTRSAPWALFYSNVPGIECLYLDSFLNSTFTLRTTRLVPHSFNLFPRQLDIWFNAIKFNIYS